MIDKNLLLYLPFDDPDGVKAYDYSTQRHDATLTNGAMLTKDAAKLGKSLSLNGGECQTAQAIPFASDFTLTAYVKVGGDKMGWLLNFSGIDNYREQWLDVVPDCWYFVAFVRDGDLFSVFMDSQRVYSDCITGNPVGLSLNTDEICTTTANVDDVRLYDTAKDALELMEMQTSPDVEYYIDGVNFKDYGVEVSASDGLVGRLAQKECLSVDWNNYHGVVRDRQRKRFKERTITLDCFISASGRVAFVEGCNAFFKLFDGDHTRRLKVAVGVDTKPLVYEVDLQDTTDVSKKWGSRHDELMVGTFKLKLIEDEPVKRVLRHTSANNNSVATITMTSSKLLNIYWGDGTHTFNVGGDNATVTHTYALPGEYDIIVAGVIEDIKEFDTNAIVVWELLK